MKKVSLFILLPLLLLVAFDATAQAVVYSRGPLIIMPGKQKVVKKKGAEPVQRQPSRFTVEVRAADTMNMDGLFLQRPFDASDGLLLVYDHPEELIISNSNIYSPLDILFIKEDGTIVQIMTDIDLSSVIDTSAPEEPVKALLYVNGGTVAQNNIRPGDWVRHATFQRKPTVQK